MKASFDPLSGKPAGRAAESSPQAEEPPLDAVQSRSAARSEQVAKHERANLEARGAARSITGGPQNRVVQFRLEAARSDRAPDSGPEPIVAPANAGGLARAQLRLQSLAPGKRLSSSDTKLLLDQALYLARRALVAGTRHGADVLTPTNMYLLCGFAQAASAFALEDLGVAAEKIHLHQSAVLFGGEPEKHAFAVAEMPDGKKYLIDASFQQFFDRDHYPARVPESGPGRRIADELVTKGYVELTESSAREYALMLSDGRVKQAKVADFAGSTAELDYDRSEIAQPS